MDDILGDNTSEDVIMQLDTGNASVVPGVDIVEYERPAFPPLEALKANLDNLHKLGR